MTQIFRYISLFILPLLFSCNDKNSNKQAEAANNDAIAKYLKLASNDSLSFEERDRWNEKAFSMIDLSKNDTLTKYYLGQSARYYGRTKNKYKYFKISKLHFEKSSKAKDTLNIARFYRYRAGYHKNNTKQYDSMFYYYIKAEKFYKKTKDFEGLARVCFYKGNVQYDFDDYLGAELSINKAYGIIKKRKGNKFTFDVLILLGNNAHNLGNFEQAIKFHNEALKLALDLKLSDKNDDFNYISTCFNNIGNSYKEMKKFEKAIFYFKKGLTPENLNENEHSIYALLLVNLGYCKLQLKQYEELPYLFIKSDKIFDSLGVKNESAMCKVYLSDYYFRIKDTLKAVYYSEKALQLAKEAKAPYFYLIALSQAGFVNKSKASKYIKEYHVKNDSIQFEQRKTRNQFFKIQLEIDEINQEKALAIKQKWLITSVISGVLLIVILLFVIYRQRTNQKELQLLQNQQKSNEEIYQLMLNQQNKVEEARQKEKKRIALELHDGIMNKLASTRLNLFVLSKKTDPETIKNCLNYIEDIHQIESEIRNVSHDLNQELFEEKDSFMALLKQFISEQNIFSETIYTLHSEGNINWELISSQIKMHLYRIIQEASYNINKYAKAKKVIICFTVDKENLCISLNDNGIGFDPEKVKEGIGLKNMQQRMESLDGFFSVKSKENRGTTLYFKIPII